MKIYSTQPNNSISPQDTLCRPFPKGSKWPAEGPHYTLGSTRGGAHTWVLPGAD